MYLWYVEPKSFCVERDTDTYLRYRNSLVAFMCLLSSKLVISLFQNTRESLPSFPLSGMLNKSGGKVRLTFKLELDQLWLGTKERTEKLPLNSIKVSFQHSIH